MQRRRHLLRRYGPGQPGSIGVAAPRPRLGRPAEQGKLREGEHASAFERAALALATQEEEEQIRAEAILAGEEAELIQEQEPAVVHVDEDGELPVGEWEDGRI